MNDATAWVVLSSPAVIRSIVPTFDMAAARGPFLILFTEGRANVFAADAVRAMAAQFAQAVAAMPPDPPLPDPFPPDACLASASWALDTYGGWATWMEARR